MGRKHFTEEQIAHALRQHEAGAPVAHIIRKLAVSEQTFYRWKKKYAGLGISELRRLKQLEEENRKLKCAEPALRPARAQCSHSPGTSSKLIVQ